MQLICLLFKTFCTLRIVLFYLTHSFHFLILDNLTPVLFTFSFSCRGRGYILVSRVESLLEQQSQYLRRLKRRLN